MAPISPLQRDLDHTDKDLRLLSTLKARLDDVRLQLPPPPLVIPLHFIQMFRDFQNSRSILIQTFCVLDSHESDFWKHRRSCCNFAPDPPLHRPVRLAVPVESSEEGEGCVFNDKLTLLFFKPSETCFNVFGYEFRDTLTHNAIFISFLTFIITDLTALEGSNLLESSASREYTESEVQRMFDLLGKLIGQLEAVRASVSGNITEKTEACRLGEQSLMYTQQQLKDEIKTNTEIVAESSIEVRP
jgi:hypothetical protein